MKVAAARAPRSLIGPAIVAAGAFAVLVSLGVWQLQRKAWKEGLIATMSQRAVARPIDLPAPAAWDSLMPAADEFRRVKLRAQFVDGAKAAFLFTGGSALRDDIKTPGYFVFAPAKLANGKIELMEPSRPGSPIAKFLERNPKGGIHHFSLNVDDMEQTARALGAGGVRILGDGNPQYNVAGERITFVHPADFLGALVELEQHEPK